MDDIISFKWIVLKKTSMCLCVGVMTGEERDQGRMRSSIVEIRSGSEWDLKMAAYCMHHGTEPDVVVVLFSSAFK